MKKFFTQVQWPLQPCLAVPRLIPLAAFLPISLCGYHHLQPGFGESGHGQVPSVLTLVATGDCSLKRPKAGALPKSTMLTGKPTTSWELSATTN